LYFCWILPYIRTSALLVCAAVSLSDSFVEMQVAGIAFLLGGVAMFAYQVWAWWRHNQQVRAYREICMSADILEQERRLSPCFYIVNLGVSSFAQQPCPSG